jgi:hypothetical protein
MSDEGGTKSFKFRIAGCGCGCLILILLLAASFVCGARYGKDFIDRTVERIESIWGNVKDGVNETKDDAAQTIDSAKQDMADSYNENIETNEYSD